MPFEINGTALTYIQSANWDDMNLTQKLDGTTLINNHQQHTWGTNIMTASEFDSLFALQGQRVRIRTIDIDGRLSFKDYMGDFLSINGTHQGVNFAGVSLKFLVVV